MGTRPGPARPQAAWPGDRLCQDSQCLTGETSRRAIRYLRAESAEGKSVTFVPRREPALALTVYFAGKVVVDAAQQILDTFSLNKPIIHTNLRFDFMRHNRIAIMVAAAVAAGLAT